MLKLGESDYLFNIFADRMLWSAGESTADYVCFLCQSELGSSHPGDPR